MPTQEELVLKLCHDAIAAKDNASWRRILQELRMTIRKDMLRTREMIMVSYPRLREEFSNGN
jgi:hypothetical protein